MAMASCLNDFVLAALREDQRIDGRRPFDSRRLSIKFGREDGAAEVQLGQTHVMCVVSGQLVQPYPERPNEGSLVVFTEFSPMADPAFEPGRPGENAVELGRVVDRGLRESRAIDTESLCVLAGKAVWSLRVDIHILDNGGNLIDAANVAALAALLSFRRPECSIGGPDGQEVIIHPPEMREPLPLIIHYLPIAVTFAFFGDGELVVMDPSFKEELIMRGRLTITMNIHGDICAIQKGGGIGVTASEIMRCLRIASTKAADVTTSLKKAAEIHEVERAQRKIKRHRNVSAQEIGNVMKNVMTKDVEMKDASVVSASVRILERGLSYQQEVVNTDTFGEEDSSSDDSDDDSDTEEEEFTGDLKSVDEKRGSNQQFRSTVASELSKGALFEGGASQWQEDKKPSLDGSLKTLAAHPLDEFEKVAGLINQAAVIGQAKSTQATSSRKFEASSISIKREGVDIDTKLQEDIFKYQSIKQEESTLTGSKGDVSRPLSLLDAVKKKNSKKKKGSSLK